MTELRDQRSDVSKATALRAGHFCAPSFLLFAVCTFLVLTFSAQAQQPAKVRHIAYVFVAPLSANSDRIEGFRQGLREIGYVEGRNILIQWRSADGKLDRVPALVAELVQLKVDVIVTAGQGAPVLRR